MADDATAKVRRQIEELGKRYVDLVYQAAVRQLGGEGRGAEDVTQAVFLLVMRKAKTGALPEEGRMAGWLQNVTRYAVKEARRRDSARRCHEEKAAAGRGEAAEPEADATEVRRVLDQALSKLGAIDREVVVRRYLRGEAVGEVAIAVGLAENTVSQRIVRALEKLQKVMVRKGVIVPAAGLAAVMIAEGAKAAPVELVVSMAGVSGSASAAVVGIAKGAAAMAKIATAKMAALIVGLLLILGIGAGVIVRWAVRAGGPPPHVSAGGMGVSTAPASAPNSAAPPSPAEVIVAQGAKADQLLDSALKTIADQQKAVKNLRATGVLKFEYLNYDTKQWELYEDQDVTVTYAEPSVVVQEPEVITENPSEPDAPKTLTSYGQPGTKKCRIVFRRWTIGFPSRTQEFTEVHDGKLTLRLNLADSLDNPCPLCTVAAYPIDSSFFEESGKATGWAYSTLGWVDGGSRALQDPKGKWIFTQGVPFLAYMEKSRQSPGFRVEEVTEGEREFLKIIVPYPGVPDCYQAFWLDAKKGYAFARQVQHLKGAHDSRLDATAFTEPLPGLFFPTHIVQEGFRWFPHAPAGQPTSTANIPVTRQTVDISDVTANTAANEDDFNLDNVDLPDGTPLMTFLHPHKQSDGPYEGRYAAGTPEEKRQLLDKVIEEVRAADRAKRDAQTQPAATQR